MIFHSDERIPTEAELKKTYGFTIFPNNIVNKCCGESHYLMDFFTHRILYHKQTYKEATRELEEFLEEQGLGKK